MATIRVCDYCEAKNPKDLKSITVSCVVNGNEATAYRTLLEACPDCRTTILTAIKNIVENKEIQNENR